MIPRSLPKLQSSITILFSGPGLIPRLSRATKAVGFCFPTLSLLCLREVLLCLSCLFQEMASREGEKKLSCLLLPAASTGRCRDRCKFSWNRYTVLYACCRLQETLPKSPFMKPMDVQSSRSGDAGGTAGGLLGSAVSLPPPPTHSKWRLLVASLWPWRPQPLLRVEKLPVLGETELDTDAFNLLGSRYCQRQSRSPEWESRAVPLGKGSWKASQNKGNLELSLGEWFSLGLRL